MKRNGKGFSVSINLTIFALFTFLLVTVTSLIIGVTYLRNTHSALVTANHLMEELSEKVYGKIKNLYDPLMVITEQTVSIPSLSDKPTLQNHPGEQFFLNTMESYPQIQMIYLGYGDGDFYEIFSLRGVAKREIQDAVQAPENAEFAIMRQFLGGNGRDPVRLWKYLNGVRLTIGSRKEFSTEYDPRERPWYRNAQGQNNSVKTDPYLFATANRIGLTLSREIQGRINCVIGIDILMDEMETFFEEISSENKGLCFILNSEKRIIYYPHSLSESAKNGVLFLGDIDAPDPDIFNGDHQLVNGKEEMDLSLQYNKETYIIKVKKLPEAYGNDEYMFFLIPEKVILGEASATAEITVFISLLIVLMGIPLILLFSRFISSPINKLTIEAAYIKAFDLSTDIEIYSNIKEINNLSKEMTSMKKGLRYFNKYVPSKLVKELMESGTGAEIGGEKREMSFFFSDIENFTRIAEHTDAERLLIRLSNYFEIVSTIIRERDGTVDKYIGDAVMAFWNAPLDDPDHVIHACESAILVQKEITQINSRWSFQGLEPFHTRIGLSCGEAIVGNIGSSDRINYTVLGDPVNFGSRLEGINKIYKTKIIVSHSMIKQLPPSFSYRPLDQTIVKGKTIPQTIYELVGFTQDLTASEKDFVSYFTEGFNLYFQREWGGAEEVFLKAKEIKPEDYALQYFLEKILSFKDSPPDPAWNGIRRQVDKL